MMNDYRFTPVYCYYCDRMFPVRLVDDPDSHPCAALGEEASDDE